jgi:hypothetical protein
MRRLGIRSAREIERERYALKALRGDFAGMEQETADVLRGTPAGAIPQESLE